ncbi:MAG: carboxyltransferase domain-containing protein [Silicimonas sp.]|nr:carboxyltransferase domain-containing protein [Silicimonas sp.]
MSESKPTFLPLGPDGILIRFADTLSEPANRAALAFRAAMSETMPDGVTETATSLTSVFLRFRPNDIHRAALEDIVRDKLQGTDWFGAPLPSGRKLWRLPTSFGGDDGPALEEAATLAGVSTDTAVDEICANPLRVLALGFAPGQPYLGFLPKHWDIPRQSDVTPQVPQGAVVVAVCQVIPFASSAPTGWRQIGRTAFRCYNPDHDDPLPLRPGDEVGFFPVSPAELTAADDRPFGGAEVETL